MASTNVFQYIFKTVDTALATYISDTASSMIGAATPMFISMVVVWMVMWGYLMIYGRIQEALTEGIFRIIKITAILTLGLSTGYYMSIVANTLQQAPEYFAGVVSGNGGSVAQNLDVLFSKFFMVSQAAWDKGGILNGNFGLYLVSIVVLLVGTLLTIYIAFLTLLSKFCLTILLGLGPLFITSILFKSTQRFFEAWIGMVANFGILLVLASSIGKLMINIADNYIIKMAPTDSALKNLANLGDAALLCLIFALCILVVRQIPSVASSLGGGVALSTQGAFGNFFRSMRPTAIKNTSKQISRDISTTTRAIGSTVNSPIRAARATAHAYRRFKTNSIAGS